MKTYRQHYCERKHRTMAATAKCLWPRAVWIDGEGPYLVLAWCGSRGRATSLTVTLHETPDAAAEAKAFIDSHGCGGGCSGRHELVHIALA